MMVTLKWKICELEVSGLSVKNFVNLFVIKIVNERKNGVEFDKYCVQAYFTEAPGC